MYALITGASHGLGYEYASLLEDKYQLILVGRHFTSKKSGIIYFELDLALEIDTLLEKIKDYDIDIIINNAGLGFIGLSNDVSNEMDEEMIKVNIIAFQKICKFYLENNVKYLLNVSSIGAILPGPCINTYYSTKAYEYIYTKNIMYEYKKRHISIFLAGPMKTTFNSRLGKENNKYAYNASYCARKSLKKLGKRTILVGMKVKFIYYLSKIIPDKILAFFIKKSQMKK